MFNRNLVSKTACRANQSKGKEIHGFFERWQSKIKDIKSSSTENLEETQSKDQIKLEHFLNTPLKWKYMVKAILSMSPCSTVRRAWHSSSQTGMVSK